VLYRILNGADFFFSKATKIFSSSGRKSFLKVGDIVILLREVFIFFIKLYYLSGPDVAVLRSVSEDDLTNVVQLSPLGKQDHHRTVFYRAAASKPHYFCKLDPEPDPH
jgi:hypothetical protein